MQYRADELVESWHNGNRQFVIDDITQGKSSARGALLSALIFSQLTTDDRMIFLSMLNLRFNRD